MDALTQAEISHEVYLNKLSSFYANQWNDIELDVIKAVRLAFSEFDSIDTLAEVNDLNKRIDELLEPILEGYVDEQNQGIEDLAQSEVEFQANLLQIIGVQLSAQSIALAVAQAKKKYRTTLVVIGSDSQAEDINKKLNGFPPSSIGQIQSIVRGGYTRGENINDVRVNITGTNRNKFNDGYVAVMNRNQSSIIKTARKHIESQAKVAVFKQAKTDGYVLTAVIDSHTSDICLGWDTTIILWSQPLQPLPPFHYNCRTTIIPYFRGRTIIPTGGFKWLKKQPASFQNDLIGPVRGDLLRNSGLTAEEYRKASRNNLNEPITLEQMANKNEEIAQRLQETERSV